MTYQSVEVRDAVKRSARNLAGKGQDYGVRLEIPNSMKSAMAALQSVSFELKQKFPEAKRNVLYDDESMELVLDFAVQEGKPWRRMTAGQARNRKRKKRPAEEGRSCLDADEIDSILDGGGGEEAGEQP